MSGFFSSSAIPGRLLRWAVVGVLLGGLLIATSCAGGAPAGGTAPTATPRPVRAAENVVADGVVVPVRQVADIRRLRPAELAEIMRTVQRAIDALGSVMGPHGYNFGANLGRVSGAGIDDHIHFHIVPRWNGDTNFMPVLGDTKVISEDLAGTAEKLRRAFRTRKR